MALELKKKKKYKPQAHYKSPGDYRQLLWFKKTIQAAHYS